MCGADSRGWGIYCFPSTYGTLGCGLDTGMGVCGGFNLGFAF